MSGGSGWRAGAVWMRSRAVPATSPSGALYCRGVEANMRSRPCQKSAPAGAAAASIAPNWARCTVAPSAAGATPTDAAARCCYSTRSRPAVSQPHNSCLSVLAEADEPRGECGGTPAAHLRRQHRSLQRRAAHALTHGATSSPCAGRTGRPTRPPCSSPPMQGAAGAAPARCRPPPVRWRKAAQNPQ